MPKVQRTSTTDQRDDGLPPGSPSLGEALRAVRRRSGHTLAEVAAGADISASFLSLVETGKCDITIGRLTRLVQFYGVSIADFLPQPRAADPDVVRKDERGQLHSPAEGIDIYLLTPETGRGLMPMLLEFEPGAGREDYGRHAGEEFVHVIEGELLLELEGTEPRHLYAGDSASYMGDRPHLMLNASRTRPLRVLCVDSTRVL